MYFSPNYYQKWSHSSRGVQYSRTCSADDQSLAELEGRRGRVWELCYLTSVVPLDALPWKQRLSCEEMVLGTPLCSQWLQLHPAVCWEEAEGHLLSVLRERWLFVPHSLPVRISSCAASSQSSLAVSVSPSGSTPPVTGLTVPPVRCPLGTQAGSVCPQPSSRQHQT